MIVMILDDIVLHKKNELAQFKSKNPLAELKDSIEELPPTRDFEGALLQPSSPGGRPSIRIIAEIKKASPSRGLIRSDFDPVGIACDYQKNGAAALSVLTNKKFFQGDLAHIRQVSQATSIPILKKDFIIDPYQIYRARKCGADAVLLIAAILSDDELADMINLAHRLGLSALVEVHTLFELKRVLSTDVRIIGINNRDLTNFQVDTGTSFELVQHIPDDKLVVSESGIDNKDIILSLRKAGVDAFLIGEALMKEKDIGRKLRDLMD